MRRVPCESASIMEHAYTGDDLTSQITASAFGPAMGCM
jgi:hypothetical protein